MILVGIPRLRLVDMPYQQAFAGQVRVVAGALPIFEQEIFRAAGAVLPETIDVVGRLDIGDRSRAARRHVRHGGPALLDLTPSRRMRRYVAAAVPRAAGHQAPVA